MDDNATDCYLAPGFAKGKIRTWQLEAENNNSTTHELCSNAGLLYDPTHDRCVAAVPRFPCKSGCDTSAATSKKVSQNRQLQATCPIVSGMFYDKLLSLYNKSYDQTLRKQARQELETQGCLPGANFTSEGVCRMQRYTFNMLVIFGLHLDCAATEKFEGVVYKSFPSKYSMESNLNPEQFHENVLNQIKMLPNDTECGPTNGNVSVTCESIISLLKCADETEFGESSVQGQVSFNLQKNSKCKEFIETGHNQDSQLSYYLASRFPARKCSDQISQSYFLPPQPGLPPFGPKLDLESKESTVKTRKVNCSKSIETPQYLNVPNATKFPLCVKGGVVGHNSDMCLHLSADSMLSAMPRSADFRCQAAYSELICSQTHMKLEKKVMCFVPTSQGGCDEIKDDVSASVTENRLAFHFVLPKFPARQQCLKYREECSDFIAQFKERYPRIDVDCDAKYDQKQCNSEWKSELWSCASAFDGLSTFPRTNQQLIHLDDTNHSIPLIEYSNAHGFESFSESFETVPTVAVTTGPLFVRKNSSMVPLVHDSLKNMQKKFCSCPEPLVVPDDVWAPTVAKGICCALPCRGSMITTEELETYHMIKFSISLIGVIVGIFLIATWGLFKKKRSKSGKLSKVFWMSFTSLMLSLSIFVPDALNYDDPERAWCKDNTQPYQQSDGVTVCAIQGMFIIFFSLSLCCWWFFQSFGLYMRLVRGSVVDDDTPCSVHLLCWGLPCACTIAVIASESLGYASPRLWCFIGEGAPPILEWAAFYIEVGILWIGGVYCMAACFRFIFNHIRNSKRMTLTTKSKLITQKLSLYKTPLIFVITFVYSWTVIFIFRIQTLVLEADYSESGEKWIFCLLQNYANGYDNPAYNSSADNSILFENSTHNEGCGYAQPVRIKPSEYILVIITLASVSILLFLVFGATKKTFDLWYYDFFCRSKERQQVSKCTNRPNEMKRAPSARGWSSDTLETHDNYRKTRFHSNSGDSTATSISAKSIKMDHRRSIEEGCEFSALPTSAGVLHSDRLDIILEEEQLGDHSQSEADLKVTIS